jgi:hypothetical protein
MVPLSQKQLESKFISLANGPASFRPFKYYFQKFTKIGSSGSNARHWGYFLLVDSYNRLSTCIVDRWKSIILILLEN